jgi:hypothetical protein
VQGLTLCVDRNNMKGKIDLYQDPIINRAFFEFRVFKNASSTSNNRIDFFIEELNISLSDYQYQILRYKN